MATGEPSTDDSNSTTRLLWNIDLRIIPILAILSIFQGFDHLSLSAGLEAHSKEDLGLTDSQYKALYYSVDPLLALVQIPSNVLLWKLGRPSLYLAAFSGLWGVVCILRAYTSTFGGALACRILMGLFEGVLYPGGVYLISCWYTSTELALRIGIFTSAQFMSSAVTTFLFTWLVSEPAQPSNTSFYRWVFVTFGSLTMGFSVIAMIVLPDMPWNTSRWITEPQISLATLRLIGDRNKDDIRNDAMTNSFHSIIHNLRDATFWLYVLNTFSNVNCLDPIFNDILSALHVSRAATLGLVTLPFLVPLVLLLFNAWNSDRMRERFMHGQWPSAVGLLGFIAGVICLRPEVRYLTVLGGFVSNIGYAVNMAWMVENFNAPPGRRAVAIAAINSFKIVFSLWIPFTYLKSQGPRFTLAFCINGALCAVSLVSSNILKARLQRFNESMDQGDFEEAAVRRSLRDDVKATENADFRFTL
ncbi:MAG: hypothetical protein M1814_001079 [Vezdaea aestivalis]|nr:MAG: hypothetical protein M1814_001079 [Vezdaea aestivalis]